MAVAFASSDVGTASGDGDVTVTKPSGLASGDLMVALCWRSWDGVAVSGFDTPSGWTALQNQTQSSNNMHLASFAKVADSTDAAASNFSFTPSSTDGDASVAVVARITGDFSGGIAALVSSIDAEDTSAGGENAVSFPTGVTPKGASALLLFGLGIDTATDIAFSGYAVANNDPSWTEQYDGISNNINYALATGSYAAATVTGAYSAVVDQNGTYLGTLIAVSETVNVSVTGDTGIINMQGIEGSVAAAAAVSGTTGNINMVGNEGTFTDIDSKWKNTDKSDNPATITNITKS